MELESISQAIIVWTGWQSAQSPRREDDLVLRHFDHSLGQQLVTQVRALEKDFYRSDAYLTAPDLTTMGRQAASEFKVRHPELSEEAVEAFAWCYTYDHK